MISHKISRKTLLWVIAAHLLVLLAVILVSTVLAPTPPPKMLEMIGLPENVNPAERTPSAQTRGEATKQPPGPPTAPATPPPAAKPTVTPPPVKPTTPETPPPTDTKTLPKEPPAKPVKTPPTKPTTPDVKVNLTPTSREVKVKPSTKPATTSPSSSSNRSTAAAVERSLSNAINRGGSGDPNAGVRGGNADGTTGSPGSPTGNANADWYRTLIKNTLERYWDRPHSDNAELSTTIRIRIQADGSIEFVSLVQSSGNVDMDNSVINAVRAAQKIAVKPPNPPYEDSVIFRLKGGQ